MSPALGEVLVEVWEAEQAPVLCIGGVPADTTGTPQQASGTSTWPPLQGQLTPPCDSSAPRGA